MILREVCTHLDCELELERAQLINEWVDSERCWILTVYPVVHDKEFSIRRFDSHRFHGFKVASVHALMEIAVIQNHTALLTDG